MHVVQLIKLALWPEKMVSEALSMVVHDRSIPQHFRAMISVRIDRTMRKHMYMDFMRRLTHPKIRP